MSSKSKKRLRFSTGDDDVQLNSSRVVREINTTIRPGMQSKTTISNVSQKLFRNNTIARIRQISKVCQNTICGSVTSEHHHISTNAQQAAPSHSYRTSSKSHSLQSHCCVEDSSTLPTHQINSVDRHTDVAECSVSKERNNDISIEDTANAKDAASHDCNVEDGHGTDAMSKAKRIRNNPLDEFKARQDECLNSFVRLEYSENISNPCPSCHLASATLTCFECFQFKPQCQSCIVEAHRSTPLHRVHYFDGFCWRRTTLRQLGLVIYLGHDGAPCPGLKVTRRKAAGPSTITVLDLSGIQKVSVLFCTCEQRLGVEWENRNQLIAVRWFPATGEQPQTVATFDTMDKYEALSLQSKISGHDFYQSLVRITSHAGPTSHSRRYEEFMRICREYDYIKLLQRSGKFLDKNGPSSTKEGELALECPACPHPKRNLPDDWQKRDDSWKYTMYIMVDANFRLKQKAKGILDDPELGPGHSFFVEEKRYKEHIKHFKEEKEINYCDSQFRAIDHANLRGGKGYDASGVVAVQCRHMMVRKNGIGDLQKGERYCNVDYVVLSALRNFELNNLVISYDIACQYHRNFLSRMSEYPLELQLKISEILMEYVIPKFHIAGHGKNCQTRYSLNFRPHMARTDGENIERGWAGLNPVSMATKEMGPGSRHDTLNKQLQGWNWDRLISFGTLFFNKLREAQKMSLKYALEARDFSNGFPTEVVKEIEDAIQKWNADPEKSPDPYCENKKSISPQELGKTLAKLQDESGIHQPIEDGMSLSNWLLAGLELEEEQWNIKALYKQLDINRFTAKNTDAEEKNIALHHRIKLWQSIQVVHMPRLAKYDRIHEMEEDGTITPSWETPLYLPSSLSREDRKSVCEPELMRKETILREVQASSALDKIRVSLRNQKILTSKKKEHITGPGQYINTRASARIRSVKEDRNKHVERYRAARSALMELEPDGNWSKELKELLDGDIELPGKKDDGKGEGKRTISWIWKMNDAANLDPSVGGAEENEVDEGLRVEYAKALARAKRWEEEEILLKEEMRRVICFLDWRAKNWLKRGKKYDGKAKKGAIAYANRQALLLRDLGETFRKKWLPILKNSYELPECAELALIPLEKVHVLPCFVHDDSEE